MGLSPDQQHQRLYDRTFILDLAASLGVLLTNRSLTRWVERGLIPPPAQHGLGQGKGSISGWTREQVIVCLTLFLCYQRNGVFKCLYHLPVYAWLYAGDAAGISLPQVQRAMRYWAHSQPLAMPQRLARREAYRHVRMLAGPDSKEVRALVRELAVGYAGQDLDPIVLEYLLEPVVAPYSPPSSKGGLTPGHAAAILRGNKIARELALIYLDEIPAPLWEWARTQILVEEAEAQLGVEAMEKALASGSFAFCYPAGKQIFSSCIRLLTMLGYGYCFTHPPMPLQDFPPALHPTHWETDVRTARLESRLELSPLPALDDLQLPFHFKITLTLLAH